MKRKRDLAFIVELFLLFVILLFVIVVITKMLVTSRNRSLYAKHLTEAVTLAESSAEVIAAAGSQAEAERIFGELSQVTEVNASDGQIVLAMDFDGKDGGADQYRAVIELTEEPQASGTYLREVIEVFFADQTDPIYTLETGTYGPAR